ncbi:MAG TPA: hypothetical protein VJK07_00360 [Candidatus Nanoarchaeia archaeon]|nr:hypothetical protein [Candidatus Nanoarchaeia archaeon]
MVKELQTLIEQDKVLFGMRECIKHGKKLAGAYVPADGRAEIIDELEKMGIDVNKFELTKKEVTEKLALGFMCEVFGVKK